MEDLFLRWFPLVNLITSQDSLTDYDNSYSCVSLQVHLKTNKVKQEW